MKNKRGQFNNLTRDRNSGRSVKLLDTHKGVCEDDEHYISDRVISKGLSNITPNIRDL